MPFSPRLPMRKFRDGVMSRIVETLHELEQQASNLMFCEPNDRVFVQQELLKIATTGVFKRAFKVTADDPLVYDEQTRAFRSKEALAKKAGAA